MRRILTSTMTGTGKEGKGEKRFWQSQKDVATENIW